MSVTDIHICPLCGTEANESNRLITDTCGHNKCRRCFLLDEIGCKECSKQQSSKETETVNGNKRIVDESIKLKRRAQKTKMPTHIHRVQVAEGIFQYHCTNCGKRFSSRSQQYYHVACGNEKAKRFQCLHCEKAFATRSHLNYHSESHSSQLYKCTQCDKHFSNRRVWEKHNKNHQIVPSECTVCGKTFRCKDSLSAHVDAQHRNSLRFQCNVCEKKYSTKSTLQQHMLKHLAKKHECQQCGKRFQRNSTLQLHVRKHSKTDFFVCQTCSKKFSDAAGLMRHAMVHDAIVKYKCIHCDIISIRKDNMLRHVRNMHLGEAFENCVEIVKQLQETLPAPQKSKQQIQNPGICEEEINDKVANPADATVMPMSVKNSCIIKCIGNVQPIQIPTITAEQTDEPLKYAELKCNENFTALSVHKKLKKKYDPIEMYRKILIADDEDAVATLATDAPHQPDVQKGAAADIAIVKTVSEQQQRATPNASNFSEMHWRKNFKYTYEYQYY